MYLITKWFGVFLCDTKKIEKYILFPNNEEEIIKRLQSIEQKEILTEEKKIIQHHSVKVQEKRLIQLGEYTPEDPIFNHIDIQPQEYDFSPILLHKILKKNTQKKIDDQLKSEDLQIIQMVEALDDLLHTANLLSERLASWSILKTAKEKQKPFENLQESVQKEMKRLEQQIEKDMNILAPNITKIIGPLIGARLISKAGGLQKLALLPASTIQILGAEKALFRFKKEGGRPPKHGVIFQYQIINMAPKEQRGRIARILASVIATAAKADVFTKRDLSEELLNQFTIKLNTIKKSG